MGVLDGPLRTVSKKLIKKFGTPGVVTFVNPRPYTPGTGKTLLPYEDPVSVKGILEQYKARFGEAEAGGVRARDLQYTVAAAGLPRTPTTTDRTTIENATYQIIHCDPTYSGDQVALYALHLRR